MRWPPYVNLCWFGQRVVCAHLFDNTTVTRRTRICYNNTVKWRFFRAHTFQTNFNCHVFGTSIIFYFGTVYCITDALIRAVKGDVETGLVFAGSNAYRIKEIVKVRDLINELVEEANIKLEESE